VYKPSPDILPDFTASSIYFNSLPIMKGLLNGMVILCTFIL